MTESLVNLYRMLLGIDNIESLDLITEDLIAYATDIGFGPILYSLLIKKYQNFSNTTMQELQSADMCAQLLVGNQIDALRNIESRCLDYSEGIVLLKGMSAAFQFYPKPYMRVMGDLDILVSQALADKLEAKICPDLGFVKKSQYPEEFYQGFHHKMPLFHPSKNTWLEIHTSLISPNSFCFKQPVFEKKNVEREIINFDNSDLSLQKLSAELELVYWSVHWAYQLNWCAKGGIRFLDMIFLLNNKNLNWNKIFGWLSNSSLAAKPLYLVLLLANKHQLTSGKEKYLSQLDVLSKNLSVINKWILCHFVEVYLFRGKSFGRLFNRNNVSIIWETLINNDRNAFLNLFIFVPLNLIFPPKSIKRFNISFQLSRLRNFFVGKGK